MEWSVKMKNKILIILFIYPILILGLEHPEKRNYEIELENKRIGIVSNIGNMFVSFNWKGFSPPRYFNDVSSWQLDKYISKVFLETLKKKNLTADVLRKNKSLILFSDMHNAVADNKYYNEKLLLELENFTKNNEIDVLFYIDKFPELTNGIPLRVNKKNLYHTTQGLYKNNTPFSNYEELTSTIVIRIIELKKVNSENKKTNFAYTYFHSSKELKKEIWLDSDKRLKQADLSNFEEDMKLLYKQNIDNFMSEFIKNNKYISKNK
jgi:hypothetical protein